MSNLTIWANEQLSNSTFINDDRRFEVRNAVIIFKNFRGETNKFGNSSRVFGLVISEEEAGYLKSRGFNVKVMGGENTDDIPMYFITVKVKMDSAYPPIVTVFSDFKGQKSRRTLNDENIGELDRIRFTSADCIINCVKSKVDPSKTSGYLQKLNVIQEIVPEFGGKYDDWMDNESSGAPSYQTPNDDDETAPF